MFTRGALPASSPFPDPDSGRVLQIIDAYGKGDINSPAFDQSGEAFALFLPRNAALTFASLQMTVQSLFSASNILPLFTGGAEIASLKTAIFIP